MTKREKRLGGILLAAALILGHVYGIKKFAEYRQAILQRQTAAQLTLTEGENSQKLRDSKADEIDWLAKHEPKPQPRQNVETILQDLASKEATRQGLEIKRNKFLTPDETGVHYHRVKAEFVISGTEASLYRWLDVMQMPDGLRAITSLRLTPQRDDETKVDCTMIVEQWYVPAPPTS